jgi:uncharacterized protein GlcG (DUF336 family)
MAHLRDARALTLEAAKAAGAAAERYASERGWTVAIAVVDQSGGLMHFLCLDGTQPGSQELSILKARTAARYHRPTKALEDGIAGGRMALLSIPGILALEGGIPIRSGGTIVGAIGVSGMVSAQDGEVAAAGLAALAL